MDATVDTIIGWSHEDGLRVAVGVNAHVCNLARHDEGLSDFLDDSDLNYADGQSVVWASRIVGLEVPERAATTDLAPPLLRAAADEGVRVFFYGGRPGVAEQAAEAMRRIAPGVQIATHHGYVKREQMSTVLDAIRAHGTDLLFVGLGDPAQQEWVRDHGPSSGASVVLTCGGLFDWLSGANKRAPSWMIAAGLEWMWRLVIEPKRLARRYLVGNPAFVLALARQLANSRTRSIGQAGHGSASLAS
ncbi:MAG: WecB/TagA/CpsF family glycosyltransferase [Microbacterium sp.]|uniref:WecB/TagA/CpsF family glycosyltransferase n=1 Tax=Microbacterium sp. TaxID=51671 RepID=UPI002725A46F|nr:WecB/TagA/CpsF family glycosyltransferase [Microbacterium sp.]MDO8383764.1 WecB/TagA/CpsF family glycosyltransferase [Microbacterium sp.]